MPGNIDIPIGEKPVGVLCHEKNHFLTIAARKATKILQQIAR
jgi:hypothetical protein